MLKSAILTRPLLGFAVAATGGTVQAFGT